MKELKTVAKNGRVFEPCYVVNDWMNLGWYIGHDYICSSYGTHLISNQTDRRMLGSFVADALFPDGYIGKVRVECTPYQTQVGDHGHSYPVSTHKFKVKLEYHGLLFDAPADGLHYDPETIEEETPDAE